MSRLGYICDGCGKEHEGVGPAGVVMKTTGSWFELCSGCYTDWTAETNTGEEP